MSNTNVELIESEEEIIKDIDIKVKIQARDLDVTLSKYAEELKRLGNEAEISSIEILLNGLAYIIRKL